MQMLIDHLGAGFSLDEFLETVPLLERGLAQRFVALAGEYRPQFAEIRDIVRRTRAGQECPQCRCPQRCLAGRRAISTTSGRGLYGALPVVSKHLALARAVDPSLPGRISVPRLLGFRPVGD